MRINYCKPIPYERSGTWTVEFANTPGGFITSWRIKSDDGRVRTGICEHGAAKVFYCEPDAPLDDLDYVLRPGDLNDCRALKATWPIWEAMRDADPESDLS